MKRIPAAIPTAQRVPMMVSSLSLAWRLTSPMITAEITAATVAPRMGSNQVSPTLTWRKIARPMPPKTEWEMAPARYPILLMVTKVPMMPKETDARPPMTKAYLKNRLSGSRRACIVSIMAVAFVAAPVIVPDHLQISVINILYQQSVHEGCGMNHHFPVHADNAFNIF